MKKIIMVGLMAWAVVAQAQTQVPVVWPFSLASSQGAMVREIVQEANASQKKFQFIFDHKPGAGGSIAVQHTLNTRGPIVLSHSDSFFIRPHMSQEGTYDPSGLLAINAYCVNQPLALIAKNFSSIADLGQKSDVTVGVIQGSITQLVAQELARQRPQNKFTEVGFKGTPEITVSMLGDHIDLSVDFPTSVSDPRIKVLGITGPIAIGGYKTLRSQGLSNFDNLTTSYYLLVNKDLDLDIRSELSSILTRASQGLRVQEFCRKDLGTPAQITGTAAEQLAQKRRDFWTKQIKPATNK